MQPYHSATAPDRRRLPGEKPELLDNRLPEVEPHHGTRLEGFNVLAVRVDVIEDVRDDARGLLDGKGLELLVELAALLIGLCRAGRVQDLVHGLVLVVPQHGVPRALAMIPGIDGRIDRRSA